MPAKTKTRRGGKRKGSEKISRERWIEIARTTLIREGIAGVKVNRLAKMLGVTRGGFYWRFKNPTELYEALLEDWRNTNTAPLLATLCGPGEPAQRLRAAFRLWIEEQDFDPSYDTAVRAWGALSRKVANIVHQVDDQRIDAFRQLFVDAGNPEQEAFIRARITYFHQVGYYAMGVHEPVKRRLELSELYYRLLSGFRNGHP
jgi:AcrR family transcriptional regulator